MQQVDGVEESWPQGELGDKCLIHSVLSNDGKGAGFPRASGVSADPADHRSSWPYRTQRTDVAKPAGRQAGRPRAARLRLPRAALHTWAYRPPTKSAAISSDDRAPDAIDPSKLVLRIQSNPHRARGDACGDGDHRGSPAAFTRRLWVCRCRGVACTVRSGGTRWS